MEKKRVLLVALAASLASTCKAYVNAGGPIEIPPSLAALDSTCKLECKGCAGDWYNVSTDGTATCLGKSPRQPTWYTFDVTCSIPDKAQNIKDLQSCQRVVALSNQLATRHFGVVRADWNETRGCHVQAVNSKFFGLRLVESQVCFGMRRWDILLGTQAAAIVLGLIAGLASGFLSRSHQSAFKNNDEPGSKEKWLPGSRMVSKNTRVHENYPNRLKYVGFYRCTQVIANLWLPVVLIWFISPWIVIPLYVVLYVIPAFAAAGLGVFTQPRHLISPPNCSLLGISPDQDSAVWSYLFHIFRPVLMVGSTLLIGTCLVHIGHARGYDDTRITPWVLNRSGYFHGALNESWGWMIVAFASFTSLIGTLLFVTMSITPVAKSLKKNADYAGEWITLEEDEELYADVQDLAEKVCEAAAADELDDEDRVNELGVSVMSKKATYFAILLALLDLGSYFYRIFTFSRDARYFLAFCITFALSEAFTSLCYNGHFCHAHHAISNTARCGIPTVHFLGLIQWDDGIAGIPSLMLSIYGLPLARPSWHSALVSIFFLASGTRALANYLGDVTDSGMYDPPASTEGYESASDEDSS